MALTAVVATALAAICAATAVGIPAPLLGLALVPGIGLVAARPERRVLRPGLDLKVLMWAGGLAMLALYVTGAGRSPENYGTIATAALVAIVPLSLLWPAPAVVRCCLLLAAGSLMGALASVSLVSWPVLGVAASAAVALVALNRLTASATAASPSTTGVRRRRVGGEAAILLAIAAVVGLLFASLLPTPPRAESQQPRPGQRGGSTRPGGQQPPYLQPTDRLDPAAAGSGKGREVVFRVQAPSAQLWRTTTLDRFDGHTWSRTDDLRASGEIRGRDGFVSVPDDSAGEFSGERFEQRVTVVTGTMGLVAAASRLSFVVLPDDRDAQVGRDGTVAPIPPLGRGATYQASSFLPDASLITEGAGIPIDLRRQYLSLQPVPMRVTELAESATASERTSYGKALALQAWFESSTEVKSGTPALAPGTDAVDQFLFVDRGGSNEQAATAMAVMLRMLGIPSRLAVGYLPGTRSAFGGEFVVRGRDSHAWAEGWFPGAGWIAFDPSGRYSPDTDDSLWSKLRRLLGALYWLLVAVVAAVAGWFAWRLLRWWRARRARPWATRAYERLTRAGRRLGRPRLPDETPVEYCTALATKLPDERLVEVGGLLTVATFSPAQPSPDAKTWADEVVKATELHAHRHPAKHPADMPVTRTGGT